MVNPSGAFSAGSSLVNGLPAEASAQAGQSSFVPNNSTLNIQNSTLTAAQLDLLSKATITIADLADGYLALTLGTTITLDIDAAGYGWFVDPTPLTHEEFIPREAYLVKREASDTNDDMRDTSDVPWQLQTASGSAAEGRIDLLTVLMHELGHVMGLGHVSSAVSPTRLMAGSIDPGIRRLPSALDLGPIELDHDHANDASRATSDDPTIWAPYLAHYTVTSSGEQTPAPVVNPARLVQAAQLPSHEGILNGHFASPEPVEGAWDRSGAVTIANGQAVLSEDSNVISTLSQLFTIPSGASHLRFTILNTSLITDHASLSLSPPDAFEVALLEAGTLTPLAGMVSGLTQTDSLLNIQADGTMFLAPGVTVTPLASSPSPRAWIVDVDLTGLPAGTAARLSFDLLGFGDRTSTVVLDNVLLTNGQPTAAPVAVNDAFTVAEGTLVSLSAPAGLLANDSDADTSQAGLSAALVSGPQHGTLTLNADGSFTYTHDGSETTTDAFTYQVSDGINLSNLATVSLTITPTNDAPSIPAIAAQSVEQGRTLSFTVVATDPDLPPQPLAYSLSPSAPSGASIDPTTGVFTWAVPRTQTVGFYTITVVVTDTGTPTLTASRTFTVEVQELTNTPPTLDPIGPKTVNEETELRFTISASDPDTPSPSPFATNLRFSAVGVPAGATLNDETGEFVWTPAEDQGGAGYQVTFSVTDGEFSASELVTITVNEVNVAPVLAPIGSKSVNEESELRFTISATDQDMPTQALTYSATGLPIGSPQMGSGMSIDLLDGNLQADLVTCCFTSAMKSLRSPLKDRMRSLPSWR